MKRREVDRALSAAGCSVKFDQGPHTKWVCPCGRHSANIPRHTIISPGVVADTIKRMQCLPGDVVAVSTVYDVRARRWARGWELHIDGVGVAQSHTLTGAEEMARDYIAMDLGVEPDSFEVTITLELGDDLDEEVEAVRRKVREMRDAQAWAAERSRSLVRRLTARGLSGKDIARILGVSPRRVSQLLGSKTGGRARGTTPRRRRKTDAAERRPLAGPHELAGTCQCKRVICDALALTS